MFWRWWICFWYLYISVYLFIYFYSEVLKKAPRLQQVLCHFKCLLGQINRLRNGMLPRFLSSSVRPPLASSHTPSMPRHAMVHHPCLCTSAGLCIKDAWGRSYHCEIPSLVTTALSFPPALPPCCPSSDTLGVWIINEFIASSLLPATTVFTGGMCRSEPRRLIKKDDRFATESSEH